AMGWRRRRVDIVAGSGVSGVGCGRVLTAIKLAGVDLPLPTPYTPPPKPEVFEECSYVVSQLPSS
ncbi:MAG: hypothetical protein ACRD3J_25705, partial [Thermoanaerobaculia bacterium]